MGVFEPKRSGRLCWLAESNNFLTHYLNMMNRIYILSRCALAVIFFYHGLIPKLLLQHEQEVLMNDALMPFVPEQTSLVVSGWMEIVLAICFLVFFRNLWLNYVAIFFLVSVTVAIAVQLPELMAYAFNPFSLNLAVVVLAVINIMAARRGQSGV
ncbi:MAG: DoxX-like family protein [Candidatus Omnitrophica bacterium]|nr:DoxX-like family protein [Candidatus Omnitrophota bacterium]